MIAITRALFLPGIPSVRRWFSILLEADDKSELTYPPLSIVQSNLAMGCQYKSDASCNTFFDQTVTSPPWSQMGFTECDPKVESCDVIVDLDQFSRRTFARGMSDLEDLRGAGFEAFVTLITEVTGPATDVFVRWKSAADSTGGSGLGAVVPELWNKCVGYATPLPPPDCLVDLSPEKQFVMASSVNSHTAVLSFNLKMSKAGRFAPTTDAKGTYSCDVTRIDELISTSSGMFQLSFLQPMRDLQ
jgi:hypothetical protein